MKGSSMRSLPRLAVLLLALVVVSCGSDDDDASRSTPTATRIPATATATGAVPPASATATQTPPASTSTATAIATATVAPSATPTSTVVSVGAIAQFSVDPLAPANPFPSDRLRDETGHVAITSSLLASIVPPEPRYDGLRAYLQLSANSANQLEGFSTFAPLRVIFDAPVAEGPPADGTVLVLHAEAPFTLHEVIATGISAGTAGADVVEIQPRTPLVAKTRYAYVLTTGVRDADGHSVRPDPDLRAALRGDIPELATWRAQLTPVLDHLRDALGVGIDEIAAIDTFTTQPTTDDMEAIVGLFTSGTLPPAQPDFDSTAIPGLVTGIFPEGSPEFAELVGSPTSETLSAVAVGVFDSYDFRIAPQRGFDPAKVSGAVTPGVNTLEFYLTIPKAPAPEAGYPITVFGHGLSQSGRDTILAAQSLGTHPGMLIGISALEHGRRGNVLQFFNFNDAFATREHFRQSVVDIVQLVNMIRVADVPPFDLVDTSHIRYFGLSLGGIMGSIFMGHDPHVEVGMLSVPGGGLPGILRSELIGQLLQPLLAASTGVPVDDPFFPVLLHNFINIAQWLVDAGDPINVAPFVIDPTRRLPGVPPKRILMHEGIRDTIVPNVTTDNLALAMGLPDAKATLGCSNAAGCNGIWRFIMTEYAQPADSGHLVTFIVPEAFAQARRFIESDGTEIIDASR
jgi:hypothetical protein